MRLDFFVSLECWTNTMRFLICDIAFCVSAIWVKWVSMRSALPLALSSREIRILLLLNGDSRKNYFHLFFCSEFLLRSTLSHTLSSALSQLEHRSRAVHRLLVVGGGVGWSYGRRQRRQTGWQSTEIAHSPYRRFFWFYRCQPLHLWARLGRWRRKVNCEYACWAQFHSRTE